jgi:UPF0176 protein
MVPIEHAYQIAAFYHFRPIPAAELVPLAKELEALGEEHGLKGLIILASEGINGTISGDNRDSVIFYLSEVSKRLGMPRFSPKWSEGPVLPFRKFKIRLRDEIVTLGKPEVKALPEKSPTHLTPEEWDHAMDEEDVVVLDTRNWYETRIGKFAGAVDPNLDEFQEFGDYLKKAELPKDKKVLIYCTGGIRCEKAIVEMHDHGFENVFQLDGGILNYLAKFPEKKFEGECFVFDQRVAVDQKLMPTSLYQMCPHCGQPADQEITCVRCDSKAVVCVTCTKIDYLKTCSKNCAHHTQLKPGVKGLKQKQGYRYIVSQPGTRNMRKHNFQS